MRTRILFLALALLLAPVALRPQVSSADDEKAIRAIETQWESA
jgi:hypothetical protein